MTPRTRGVQRVVALPRSDGGSRVWPPPHCRSGSSSPSSRSVVEASACLLFERFRGGVEPGTASGGRPNPRWEYLDSDPSCPAGGATGPSTRAGRAWPATWSAASSDAGRPAPGLRVRPRAGRPDQLRALRGAGAEGAAGRGGAAAALRPAARRRRAGPAGAGGRALRVRQRRRGRPPAADPASGRAPATRSARTSSCSGPRSPGCSRRHRWAPRRIGCRTCWPTWPRWPPRWRRASALARQSVPEPGVIALR